MQVLRRFEKFLKKSGAHVQDWLASDKMHKVCTAPPDIIE